MKKLVINIALILLLVVAIVPQTGCKGDTEETEPVASESKRWPELLRVLPENEETLKAAYLQDNAYMLEKMPQGEYPIAHNLPLFGQSPGSYSDEEWEATLGFVADDVDQTIYAGSAPPHYYEALRGRFIQDDIDNAVRTGPMNEMLEVITYQGHEFYSWGGDFEINVAMRSNVRPLGRGHRLALVDDFIFWMLWTDGIEEMIDSYEGNIKSLADNDEYQLLSIGLEELDTVTAFFSSEPQSESHFKELHQEQLTQHTTKIKELFLNAISREPKLKPYEALATGAGTDENGYYLGIVLANPDENTARENATRLELVIEQAEIFWGDNAGEKWSDHIASFEITSNSRLTLAKFYGAVVELWDCFGIYNTWGPYEPLLLHE